MSVISLYAILTIPLFFLFFFFFFFNATATTEIYTLSLHDALPISNALSFSVHEVPAIGGIGSLTLGLLMLGLGAVKKIGRAHV